MDRLILLVESRIRGDVYVRFGGELPKTHRSNTAGRWMLSLPLRSVNNLVRDARKVQQCVLMVGEMADIYVNNFRKMLADSNFSAEELTAIASGYTLLLSEGSYLLDELKQLTSVTTLRMNDYERMQMIDKVYRDITRYRNLLHYYTRKTISVSYLRGKAAGDSARVAALYGSQQERYY